MIRAGDLDRTIIIERSTDTIAPSGAVSSTFAPIATLRAKLTQITASDLLRSAGGLTQNYLVFSARWLDGVTVADQVSYLGASLTIRSVREVGRRDALEITCEALV